MVRKWEVQENWSELKAQLRVGKSMTKVLELLDDAFQEETLQRWSNNTEFIQKCANGENSKADEGCDGESSLPSAASAMEECDAPPPPPPPPRDSPKRGTPPPPQKVGRVVARKVS